METCDGMKLDGTAAHDEPVYETRKLWHGSMGLCKTCCEELDAHEAHEAVVEAVEGRMKELGLKPSTDRASTGSVYISADVYPADEDADSVTLRIRVADHGEAYPPRGCEQVSVDPSGVSLEQALNWLSQRAEEIKHG